MIVKKCDLRERGGRGGRKLKLRLLFEYVLGRKGINLSICELTNTPYVTLHVFLIEAKKRIYQCQKAPSFTMKTNW